jgi:hypothetical protein
MMFEVIVGTMLASGILGGLINFFLSDPATEKPLSWWKHIIVGVGASFIVPVFLNMISSRLIAEITGPAFTSEILSKILVLAGFCLLASVSSRAFIKSVSDKLLQEISAAKKEAQEATKQAESAAAIASLSVEPEPPNQSVTHQAAQTAGLPSSKLSDTEKKVLGAMVKGPFVMRSSTGIGKNTTLSEQDVNTALSSLAGKALAAEGKDIQGHPRWYVTPSGREAADNI